MQCHELHGETHNTNNNTHAFTGNRRHIHMDSMLTYGLNWQKAHTQCFIARQVLKQLRVTQVLTPYTKTLRQDIDSRSAGMLVCMQKLKTSK